MKNQIILFIAWSIWLIGAQADPVSCSGMDTEHVSQTWYDRSHDYLSQKFCEPAVWFDNFFSNERSDEERGPGNFVRWRNEFLFTKEDGPSLRSRISAKLELPGATKRLHVLLMREDEDDTISTLTDNPQLNSTNTALFNPQRNQLQLGLRYDLSKELLSHFNISGGIHGGTPLKPFVKGRYRYTQPLSDNLLARLIETVYWKNQEGFGETTRFDLERQLSRSSILRWSNNATFAELSNGFELGSELAFLHQLSERRAIAFSIGVSGYTQPSTFNGVTISARYRHNFFRNWLFYEIEPAISWPEDELGKRNLESSIILRLEVQFERY